MAPARVELREGTTYSYPDGTVFVRGQPKVIADEKLLALIRNNSRFHVAELSATVSEEEPETSGSAEVTEAVPATEPEFVPEPEPEPEKPEPKFKRRVGRPRKKKSSG